MRLHLVAMAWGTAALAACSLLVDLSSLRGSDAGGDATPPDVAADSPADAALTLPFFAMSRTLEDGSVITQPVAVDLVDLDGGASLIGCPSRGAFSYFAPTPGAGACGPPPNGPYLNGMLAMRGFNPAAPTVPPGPAHFVYLDVVPNGLDGGGTDYPLYVADESSDCVANLPTRIDSEGAFVPGARHVLPRFSPNGERVAYFDITEDAGCASLSVQRLLTVGIDGGSPRVLRTAAAISPRLLWLAAPAWTDNNHVAWVEADCIGACDGGSRVMSTVDTQPPPPAQPLIVCNTQSFFGIEQLEVFTNTAQAIIAMVASTNQWLFSMGDGGPSDIYYKPLGTMGCPTPANNVTKGKPGEMSRDLAVSPDGTTLAFSSNRGMANGSMHIYTYRLPNGPIMACSALDPNADNVGPQWVNGGAALVWTHLPHTSSATGAITIVDVDGGACGTPRALLSDPPGAAEAGTSPSYIAPANASVFCAMSRQRTDARSGAWFLVALLMLVARSSRSTKSAG